MVTQGLVAGFKLSISLVAPVMTMVVWAVQAVVHENHRKSVIDYLTEGLCGILHLLIRSLALALPEVLAFWYGFCPRRSDRSETTQYNGTERGDVKYDR